MKHTTKRLAAFLLALTMVVSLFAGVTLSASAKTEGPISSEKVYTYIRQKDGTDKLLHTYIADHENDTYRDADGVEMPCIVSNVAFDNYGDGNTQSYILYTGSDMGYFARSLVVTKYIDLAQLCQNIADEAGIEFSPETCNLEMIATDGWTTT